MSDDGWKWFLPAIIDFPFSELFRQIKVLPQFDVFLIFGTLWWYCVGLVYRFFYVLLVGNDNSKHPTTGPATCEDTRRSGIPSARRRCSVTRRGRRLAQGRADGRLLRGKARTYMLASSIFPRVSAG